MHSRFSKPGTDFFWTQASDRPKQRCCMCRNHTEGQRKEGSSIQGKVPLALLADLVDIGLDEL